MFFPVTEISENRLAGIQVIFWIFVFVFFFLNHSGLYPKKCYKHSQYLLANTLLYIWKQRRVHLCFRVKTTQQ